jgi:hypothetical protein
LQAALWLEFNIKQKSLHLVLCILLAGDIATNPGPTTIANAQFGNLPRSHIQAPVVERSKNNVKCLALNARSLMSVTKTNDGETVSNLERFQNFVYSEDIDVVFANETWLSNSINNAEILHSDYTIVRNDREGRGGGVLLGIRTGLFKSA